jgi:16S rRNA (cytosine1402-N4)-methyltransferase
MVNNIDRHQPVLVDELLETLDLKKSNTVIDATYGFGGHANRVLGFLSESGCLYGFERDPEVYRIARGNIADDRITLFNESYARLDEIVGDREITPDAIYFDLGVSSHHFDESPRGFSYERLDDPFDCRFNPSDDTKPAYEVLNEISADELETILREYGEVRRLKQVRDALIEGRPVETVRDLRGILESILPSHKAKGEMARVFQAFRIAVNDELEHLRDGLQAGLDVLKPGGRMSVISYHSIEDRIVKQFFRHEAKDCVCPPDLPVCACDKVQRVEVASESPLTPGSEEVEENPRARSAKLRSATKCAN